MMTPVSYGTALRPRPAAAPAQARAIRDIRSDWQRWSPGERLLAFALIVMPPAASLLVIALAGG